MFQRGTIFNRVMMKVYSYQVTVQLSNKYDLSLLFAMQSFCKSVIIDIEIFVHL